MRKHSRRSRANHILLLSYPLPHPSFLLMLEGFSFNLVFLGRFLVWAVVGSIAAGWSSRWLHWDVSAEVACAKISVCTIPEREPLWRWDYFVWRLNEWNAGSGHVLDGFWTARGDATELFTLSFKRASDNARAVRW